MRAKRNYFQTCLKIHDFWNHKDFKKIRTKWAWNFKKYKKSKIYIQFSKRNFKPLN